MIVEMITTGEEVLSGQITDTNATWISQQFVDIGITPSRRTTVGDRLEDLVSCFQERSKHADVIIVNGGLGPTSDDMSARAAALAADQPLVQFQEWVDALERKFADLARDMPASNLKQAMLPQHAEIINNPVGTACGFVMKLNRALLFFTPGVPHEMKRMMTAEIMPHIAKNAYNRELGSKATSLFRYL